MFLKKNAIIKLKKDRLLNKWSIQFQVTKRLAACSGNEGGYFFLYALITTAITAHNMITKLNKSAYVTMIPSPCVTQPLIDFY